MIYLDRLKLHTNGTELMIWGDMDGWELTKVKENNVRSINQSTQAVELRNETWVGQTNKRRFTDGQVQLSRQTNAQTDGQACSVEDVYMLHEACSELQSRVEPTSRTTL